MRLVLIGDIGWSSLYHLGDEAMTDYALEALRERGVDSVTVVAGEPEVASSFYGVEAVRRIGFRNSLDRSHNARRLASVLDVARGRGSLEPNDPAHAVIDAVRGSDAVLVAGGGNLNSFFPQHIYERAALTGVAKVLGKPYALTSQTVGPLVRDDDRTVLEEILRGALAVGAREEATERLVLGLGADPARVVRTMDDAYGLVATDADRTAVETWATGSYIVASFAEKASTTLIEQDEYHALAARTLRDLADGLDMKILLVPHAGTLVRGKTARDQESNARIASLAGERVRPTAMLTARELTALTDGAELVVGTRYHPAIFAARSAVPAISIAPNMYSSVRMRYSARNVGTGDYVLSLDTWQNGGLQRAASELLEHQQAARQHLAAVRGQRVEEHRRWWDALVSSLESGDPVSGDLGMSDVAAFRSPGDWSLANIALLEATERFDELRMTEKWRRDELEQRIKLLRRQRADLRRKLEAGAQTPAPPAGRPHAVRRVLGRVRRAVASDGRDRVRR
ncbi:polysaccharide pyruvyl transferase family protein [Isoptericola croceus]|uniref:polysaccharide pyruvyl transferase family protein n=1 Tax=Isoptericola croceus TaxID=3031406 RepID=UPI0023F8A008|nr:polysaccharide pyruvyl transferase family protein [Isoptericola croceus]